MKEIYVVNCCRTAVGSFGGSLKDVPAVDLGAVVVKEALNRAGVKPEQVDEVMFGCVLTGSLGQNVARQVGVKAGIPYSVPAYTVGMVCGSGMKTVIEGARAILAGDADIIVAGGTENMSAAPYALPAERWGARMGDKKVVDTMIKDGLWDAYNSYHMGTTAENICDVWGITREELDAFGASSQQKTEAAQKAGRFDDEIVPVMIKKKEMVEFRVDEFPRAGTTVESLGKLKGAFPCGPEGVEDEIVHTFEPTQIHADDAKKHVQRVTAGQASGINDGAAAILLASGEAEYATLIEPQVTSAMSQNSEVRRALSFEEEWQRVTGTDTMIPNAGFGTTQGFIDENPELTEQFQAAYAESVQWVLDHPAEAAALAEEHLGMKAAVVEAAIPNMGLTFKSAQDAWGELDTFYNLLNDFDPSMIGGKLPNDGLYYAG